MDKEQRQWLRAAIRQATRAAFSELRRQHPHADFCAFALYSDASAMTVLPSANHREHLARVQAENPDDPLYFRWGTAEWACEYEGAEHFAPICLYLRTALEGIGTDAEFLVFRRELFHLCVEVLAVLRQEGFFDKELLVFAVSDHEDPDEIDWMRRLNGSAEAARFQKWLAGQ